MASRKLRKSLALATKSTQLALAAPKVIAHRVSRMAQAGSQASSRDQREFSRMASEKQTAFLSAWSGMGLEVVKYQQRFMLNWFQAVWMPWLGKKMTFASMTGQLQQAAMATALSGLAPFHRTAVANAKRLTLASLP